MQYTQCKIVGNGSFGVVFQTKLSPTGEDAAIKRVLQDKRFKARKPPLFINDWRYLLQWLTTLVEPRTANHAHCATPEHR